MNKEEYRRMTGIESIEEARGILRNLNILFLLAFFIGPFFALVQLFLSEFTEVDYQRFAGFASVFVYGTLAWFAIYSYKVLKKERITKTSFLFAIFFAPISWIWFYPEITDPLKIIIGDKYPPDVSVKEYLEKIAPKEVDQKKSNRRVLNMIIIVSVLSFISIFILSAILIVLSP